MGQGLAGNQTPRLLALQESTTPMRWQIPDLADPRRREFVVVARPIVLYLPSLNGPSWVNQ